MSAIWQTAAYVLRDVSIKNPTSITWYAAWFVLILVSPFHFEYRDREIKAHLLSQVAPLWTNAYVYMVVGRLVYNFTKASKVLRISAWRFGLIFIILDIV